MNTIKVDEKMNEYFIEFDENINGYKMKHFDIKIKELKNIHKKEEVSNDAKENK